MEQVVAALEEAAAGGASDAQLAILREAQRNGELSFDQAREATFATIGCIEEAGGSASYFEQREESGLVVPTGVAQAKDEESLTAMEPIIDECSKLESYWVNKVYQLQPESQEVRDAYVETQAPLVRECLEDHGYPTDPQATAQELVRQALAVSSDTNNVVSCYH